MKTPKHGGHRKPGAAAKHIPEGYEQMKRCPTCKGSGSVATSTVKDMALKRV